VSEDHKTCEIRPILRRSLANNSITSVADDAFTDLGSYSAGLFTVFENLLDDIEISHDGIEHDF
jgi:hypothetical protein